VRQDLSQTVAFGIVGGYGATGRVVVSELSRTCSAKVLIGGRDLDKGKALAAEFEHNVSATLLDVLDTRSLDDFCRRCSIVVNCGGPVTLLQDRVAQAAFRNRCHYIDAAGMSVVRERILPHAREIEDAGLSFVISAGWMPGVSEFVPVYADAQARLKMDTTESLTVYFCDSGEWSNNALVDGVKYIHQVGLRNPGYFRRGEWVRANMSTALRKFNLGDPVGSGRFLLCSPLPELREFAQRLKDCDVFTYTYLSGFRTVIDATLMALFPLPEGLGVRLLRNVFRRNRLPVGGFVIAKVHGRSQGGSVSLTVQITFKENQDYWINGVVLATVARMISDEQSVQRGIHFLADAVNRAAFMAELRKGGIEQTENFAESGEG